MKRLLTSFLVLLLLPVSFALSWGAAADWEVFMSVHTVRALIRVGDDLWSGTNSGLFRFHLPTETFEGFTNADGLSSNDIRALALDGRGNLILGMGNAYVDVFNLSTHQVTSISDFTLNDKVFQVFSLYNDQGTIYVGTDIGVSRLTYFPNWQRYLIEGNYSNLGNFPSEIPAKAIQVFDGGLWVATAQGLARGDLSLPYLESPESWSNYTTANGLSGNNIAALTVFDSTLYAAANNALNRLSGSGFESLQVSNGTNIALLRVYQDTLYFGRGGGIYRLDGDQGIRYGTTPALGLALEFAGDGTMWAGMQTIKMYNSQSVYGGLKKFIDGNWIDYAPDGPGPESIYDILVQEDGSVWVTGTQYLGFNNGCLSHFDGLDWTNVERQGEGLSVPVSSDSFFWYETRALNEDKSGSIWASSDGRGVGWFTFQGDTIVANGYYSADSSERLWGIPNGASYCVVRDLLTDEWGNIWICNSEADPDVVMPIAIVPADFIQDPVTFPNWYHTTIRNEFGTPLVGAQFQVDRISEDSFGRLWFGANNNSGDGVWILDNKGTAISDTDDVWTKIYNLPSDSITAITCDRDGIVWVGTPAGAQYFYPTENVSDLQGIDLPVPIGQSVRAIAVDPQNNKWFGTASGVSVLGADNFTWLNHYTTAQGQYPSALPGDVVQAIAFDGPRGYAYLGTDKGLARLQTPYKQMGQSLTSISVWPNPFVITSGGDNRLFFDPSGLSEVTEMKVFTAAGLLVRHLATGQINSGWDGRNMNNELVGTGIYLLLAYSPDGSARVSKVAVVHQ